MSNDEVLFYFAVRQNWNGSAGKWIAQGPYKDYDSAKSARERAKAPDMDVGIPFGANSKAEAQTKIDAGMI